MHKSTRKVVLAGADAVAFVADSQRASASANAYSWRDMEANLTSNGIDFAPDPEGRAVQQARPARREAARRRSRTPGATSPTFPAVAIRGEGVRRDLPRAAAPALPLDGRAPRLRQKFGVSEEDFLKGVFKNFSPAALATAASASRRPVRTAPDPPFDRCRRELQPPGSPAPPPRARRNPSAVRTGGSESHDAPACQAKPPSSGPAQPPDEIRAALASVEAAIEDIRAGKLVILVDDEDRENEGDLCMAAEKVTPEAINFMAKHGRGLICLSLTEEQLEQLRPLDDGARLREQRRASAPRSRCRSRRATASPPASRPPTARTTILAAIADDAKPVRPRRAPATSSRCARARAACCGAPARPRARSISRGSRACSPAGVICEIMNDDGTMARCRTWWSSARQHDIKIVTIADLIQYRLRKETLVRRAADATMPTRLAGEFRAIVYENDIDHVDHMALVKGDDPRRRAGAGARAQRVPDRRRLRLAALRLRRAARGRDEDDRGGGPRRAALHAPGRPRHRAEEQDPRLRAAGPGRPRHGRGQRAARLPARPARLRRGRADPARPRRAQACA